jgi:hypothetical protein
MISKIKIGNFKSIEKLELELAPLTIFVGPNASGKSNVLESIAILAQTPKLSGSIIRSLAGSLQYGELVHYPLTSDFPLFDFIAHKKNWSNFITFEIHIKDEENHDIGYSYAFMPQDKAVSQAVFTNDKKLLEVGYLKSGESSWRKEFLYPEEFKQFLISTGGSEYIFNPSCFDYSLKASIPRPQEQHIEEIIFRARNIVKKI